MGEEIRHNCGLCVAHTLHDVYSFLGSLQHRGRDAAGIAAIGNQRIDVVKWKGAVDTFDVHDLHKLFPSDSYEYHTYMAHVRYATRGRKDRILEDAHPHVLGGIPDNRESHIIIEDCNMAIVHNGQVNSEFINEIDFSILQSDCDTEALLHLAKRKGPEQILETIPGSYTLAIADKSKRDVIVMRDRTGIKPGVLGWKDGKYCIASEDSALRKNGAEIIEQLEPGFLYKLNASGSYTRSNVIEGKPSHCFFEWNYISNIDTSLDGASVRKLRESLGEELAKEFSPDDADFVSFLPRCPEAAARSYSKKTGIPFTPIFYKMRSERSFLGSTSEERRSSINGNMNLLTRINKTNAFDFLKDKTIILIDDSTVRGNNSLRARDLLYEGAGVKKVYFVNYTPPIGIIGEDNIPRGCMFGVDMPPNDNFIARDRTLEEISDKMGMQTIYLSREGMFRAFEKAGMPRKNLCSYCVGGEHPFNNL